MVERRSPKPEVGGSIPSAPAKNEIKKMINPLKFIQGSKTGSFQSNLAKKRSNDWFFYGLCFSNDSSNIFFIIRSNI